jgi:hypothetical protein
MDKYIADAAATARASKRVSSDDGGSEGEEPITQTRKGKRDRRKPESRKAETGAKKPRVTGLAGNPRSVATTHESDRPIWPQFSEGDINKFRMEGAMSAMMHMFSPQNHNAGNAQPPATQDTFVPGVFFQPHDMGRFPGYRDPRSSGWPS